MAESASLTGLPVTPSPIGQSPVRTSEEVPIMVSSVMEGTPTTVTNIPAVSVGTTEVTLVSSAGLPGSLSDPGTSTSFARLSVVAGTSITEGSPATTISSVTAGAIGVTLESTTVVSTVPLCEAGTYPFVSPAQLDAMLPSVQEEPNKPPAETYDARRMPLFELEKTYQRNSNIESRSVPSTNIEERLKAIEDTQFGILWGQRDMIEM